MTSLLDLDMDKISRRGIMFLMFSGVCIGLCKKWRSAFEEIVIDLEISFLFVKE